MRRFLIILLAAILLFSGCVGQKEIKAVKNGDNVSVDYIGSLENGTVFDTSIESVAKDNNLLTPNRDYKPLKFTVGKGEVIKGFDEGVIGMKIGESRTLNIPPEKAYGPINPSAIQVIPIVQSVPATRELPKVFEIPLNQFEGYFGKNHTAGETVKIPETNINLTIQSIASSVSLAYNVNVGTNIWDSRAPWNETVIKVDDKNITLKAIVTKNSIIQLPSAPWNTTVLDVNNTNITLKHNAIPDTQIPTMLGTIRVHFNETSIIMDQNSELAGKTLIFNVTLRSIN